jgi:hypothetical protein
MGVSLKATLRQSHNEEAEGAHLLEKQSKAEDPYLKPDPNSAEAIFDLEEQWPPNKPTIASAQDVRVKIVGEDIWGDSKTVRKK